MNNKYRNNVIIHENVVEKKYNKNIFDIYDIFEKCGFDNYSKIVSYDDESIRYECILERDYYETVKGEEFINVVSTLHNRTQKYIDVDIDKYTEIYNLIKGNINYLKKYYDNFIESIEYEEYMMPSSYLIARNYSIIVHSLEYSLTNLEKWYKQVSNNLSDRVCVIHNNLCMDHFIYSDKGYLVSFDRALVDTPVLDLYKLYKNEINNLNFDLLIKKYNDNFVLSNEEKMLFFVLISIPPKIEKTNDEFNDCVNIGNIFRTMYKTMKFINKNNNLQM